MSGAKKKGGHVELCKDCPTHADWVFHDGTVDHFHTKEKGFEIGDRAFAEHRISEAERDAGFNVILRSHLKKADEGLDRASGPGTRFVSSPGRRK